MELSLAVGMTTLQEIELRCPVCATRFRSHTVVATNAFGGKRTDFHERAAGRQPLPYLVHMCTRCGYAGGEREFADDGEASPVLKQLVWRELSPLLAAARGAPVAGSDKYDAAARVAEWQASDPRAIGDLYLRAAWCCVDEGDVEAERYYRRKAAWMFDAALAMFDGVPWDERAVITYLIGELWRRIGDLEVARQWFDRVAQELTPGTPSWVADAAQQQRERPREWFS